MISDSLLRYLFSLMDCPKKTIQMKDGIIVNQSPIHQAKL